MKSNERKQSISKFQKNMKLTSKKKHEPERKHNIPELVESLKMDSTIAVTSSSLIGLKASILLGEKSSNVQTFLTFT
jgi:hypothetical protein